MELTKDIRESYLWQHTLGNDSSDNKDEINKLRSSFLSFRDRASALAKQINNDLPSLTIHDVTHLDALWEMASLVVGKNYTLSPMEGYVLGGAILLHDLAMSVVATPGGYEAIKKDVRYQDLIYSAYQENYTRAPTANELSEPEQSIKEAALFSYMRSTHAENAEKLAHHSYEASNNEKIYLIDDIELRQTYGSLIGRIAHSHWWSVDKVEREFSRPLGAPAWAPNTWTVDPLKLACILRTADIIHLDARRAPTFTKAFSNLNNVSYEHWSFQESLNKPYLNDDAIVFTSSKGFNLPNASAWWLCLDTLKLADRELRLVDALLSDKALPRFQARRVAGVDLPERFTEYVKTVDWIPINATVHISDLPNVVRSLGGEQLYGNDAKVPLRELIQNSADAIRARKMYEERADDFGQVTVSFWEDNTDYFLKVSDNGIGMSQNVLTNFLLDFGTSFWSSASLQEEIPGLISKGFRPTGKYGIGFFSVFMIADSVKVVTRRSEAAQKDTVVLEFHNGVHGRPILRPASHEESSLDGGTSITLKLNSNPYEKGGIFFSPQKDEVLTLNDLCKKLAPALDVNLCVQKDEHIDVVIAANDWQTVDGEEFLSRFEFFNYDNKFTEKQIEAFIKRASKNLRPLTNRSGKMVGRGLITTKGHFQDGSIKGCISIGGLAGCGLSGISGVLLGTSLRASRDYAEPLVEPEALKEWAEQQGSLVPSLHAKESEQSACAEIIMQCGAHSGDLKVAKKQNTEWVSALDIEQMALPDKVIIAYDYRLENELQYISEYKIYSYVFITNGLGQTLIRQSRSFGNKEWPEHKYNWNKESPPLNCTGIVVEAVARAWDVSVEHLMECNNFKYSEGVEIGTHDGGPIFGYAMKLIKPKK